MVEQVQVSVIRESGLTDFWERLKRDKLALTGGVIITLLCLLSLFAPLITPYSERSIDLQVGAQPPSLAHPFGTDELGRDQLTRILYGGRVSLTVGIAVAVLATIMGLIIGGLAGFYGGFIDNLLMRLTDFMLSLPALPVIMVAGAFWGSSLINIIVILSLLSWMSVARLVRASFLTLKKRDFVQAARAIGASDWHLVWRHLLPHSLSPVIVNGIITVGLAILAESALSFLRLGIQPPTPSWGNMLINAKTTILLYPWLTWFPGLMIVITVLSFNFLGEGLKNALGLKEGR
jgi:peptide/nickel transport system permease protein